MVILADIGVIQVDDVIDTIEVDLQAAVAEGRVAGHERKHLHARGLTSLMSPRRLKPMSH
jgi:hypothetical protein